MTTITQQRPETIGLDYTLTSSENARSLTNRLSWLVRYPKRINDLGRSARVDRVGDGEYKFEVRSKRYLGRGAYSISAVAQGIISESATGGTITVHISIGKLYQILLSIMTTFVVASYALIYFTILYLPIALLMSMVIWMHWSYLHYDRYSLAQDIAAVLLGKEKE